MARTVVALVLACLFAAAASAQEAAIPAPESVSVPDLSQSGSPAAVSDGWKYFLFRKPGVGYAEAYRDFADCARFTQPGSWQSVGLNRFVPWDETPGRELRPADNSYGLIGAVIGAMVERALARRDAQANMRACMEPRGYRRVGVPQTAWEEIAGRPLPQWIATQAKIAAGPDFGGKEPVK